MKMKRVLSLLLALVMTFSLLTLPSYAEDEKAATLTVTMDGKAVDAVTLPQGGKVELKAQADAQVSDYCWQINIGGDTWVDIYGENAAVCLLTYAKVHNVLDANGKTQVRCIAQIDDMTVVSDAVTVSVADETPAPARKMAAKAAAPVKAPLLSETPTLEDEYTVTVKKGEAIIEGIATLKSVSDDKITVELDKYFISYNAAKPGGKHTIKKGEDLSFLMDGLLDATDSYTIHFE